MAINHEWVSEKLLHTKYTGHVTGADMLAAANDIAADPRMENIRFVIGDWSKIERADIEPDDVRELAALIIALAKSFPGVKNASVVANYESGEARASLYDVLIQGTTWKAATFGTVEDAKAWFDSPE